MQAITKGNVQGVNGVIFLKVFDICNVRDSVLEKYGAIFNFTF